MCIRFLGVAGHPPQKLWFSRSGVGPRLLHCEELRPRRKFFRALAPWVTLWEALITGSSNSFLLFSFARFLSFFLLIGSFYWEITHHLKKLSICLLMKPSSGSAHCAWTKAGPSVFVAEVCCPAAARGPQLQHQHIWPWHFRAWGPAAQLYLDIINIWRCVNLRCAM